MQLARRWTSLLFPVLHVVLIWNNRAIQGPFELHPAHVDSLLLLSEHAAAHLGTCCIATQPWCYHKLPDQRWQTAVDCDMCPHDTVRSTLSAFIMKLLVQPCKDAGGEQGVCGRVLWQVVGLQQLCGNGLVEGLEQCDDGNTSPGDGCSPTCRVTSLLLLHLMLSSSCSSLVTPFSGLLLRSPSHDSFSCFLLTWSASHAPLLMLQFSCCRVHDPTLLLPLSSSRSHVPF